MAKQTAADEALLKLAAKHGYSITARQLRRWRTDGLLPLRTVKGKGRAAGVQGTDPSGVEGQLLALCRWRHRYLRSMESVTLSLWYEMWGVSTEQVRAIVLHRFDWLKNRGRVQFERELKLKSKAGAMHLGLLTPDPAGRLTDAQLIDEAERDISRAALEGSAIGADEDLTAATFGFLQIARLAPEKTKAEELAREAGEKSLESIDLESAIRELETCSHLELESVRSGLRARFEEIDELRRRLDHLDPKTQSAIRDWLVIAETPFDTRDPEYEAVYLAEGIGFGLVAIRQFGLE